MICPTENGHIQAVGFDAAGRKQSIYHPAWSAISSATKFARMQLFGELLPRIRRRVRRDLKGKCLKPKRVFAAVVRLIDKAHLRIGNEEYALQHGTRGATTLIDENVNLDQTRIEIEFQGKSGKQRSVAFSDSKVAKVIGQCEEIDGQFLFKYLDESGLPHTVTSSDITTYLLEVSGEQITAKDFRTWAGCFLALKYFEQIDFTSGKASQKRQIVSCIDQVASELGNTRAVCRDSYIHPGLLSAVQTGRLPQLIAELPSVSMSELTIAESRFFKLIPRLELTKANEFC